VKWPWQKREETRTVTSIPWNVGGPSQASVTQAQALSLAPVFACNRILASSVSTLPLKAYRKLGDTREPMSSLPALFANLQTDGELVPWLHRAVTSLALRGNAYGLITQRDGFGFPTVITWLDPSKVYPNSQDFARPWLVNGQPVNREDMFHIPWFTLPGETLGLSPISAFATTINVGIQSQQYGSDWFDAGGVPSGTFKNTAQTVDQDTAGEVKRRLTNAIKTRQPIVYGNDWDYTPITVSPGEAQFIETTQMSATQIAAIYGVPPEMVGGETGNSMTYQNVEQQAINFVTFTLRPWLVLLEAAFSSILPDRQYVRFNSDALVRADLKTRFEVHAIAKGIGVLSVDDIRELEDRPPLPGGQGKDYTTTPPVAAAPDNDTDGVVTPLKRWVNPQ
jgi:HK97 family phage portal protein